MGIAFERISVELIRQEFETQPPQVQEETRSRVVRLLRGEAERNQVQPSALMRLAHVYGLRQPKEAPVVNRRRGRQGRRMDA